METKTYYLENIFVRIAIPGSEGHTIDRDILRDQHISLFSTKIARNNKKVVYHEYDLKTEARAPSFLDWLLRRKRQFHFVGETEIQLWDVLVDPPSIDLRANKVEIVELFDSKITEGIHE